MTAKEYLSRTFHLRVMIRNLDDMIAQLRVETESTGAIRYDRVRVQTTPELDPLANYMAQLETFEKQQAALKAERVALLALIEAQILVIEPEIQRQVLWLRYVKELSFQRIAREMNYSEDYIYRLHRLALRTFAHIFLESEEGEK